MTEKIAFEVKLMLPINLEIILWWISLGPGRIVALIAIKSNRIPILI